MQACTCMQQLLHVLVYVHTIHVLVCGLVCLYVKMCACVCVHTQKETARGSETIAQIFDGHPYSVYHNS
jgi:hypothetical protein